MIITIMNKLMITFRCAGVQLAHEELIEAEGPQSTVRLQ